MSWDSYPPALLRPSTRCPGSMRKEPSPQVLGERETTRVGEQAQVELVWAEKGSLVLLNHSFWNPSITTIWGGP